MGKESHESDLGSLAKDDKIRGKRPFIAIFEKSIYNNIITLDFYSTTSTKNPVALYKY